MSPSSMSSCAGVWLPVTLEPSKWKRTFFWSLLDILDTYWKKMDLSGASWGTNRRRHYIIGVNALLWETRRRRRYELCAERTPEKSLCLCSAASQWWCCHHRLTGFHPPPPWPHTLNTQRRKHFALWDSIRAASHESQFKIILLCLISPSGHTQETVLGRTLST